MSFSLFDQYDLRARMSVGIILVSPLLFYLYMQIAAIRSLSATTIIIVILFALSNYIIVFVRYNGKTVYSKRETTAEFLYSDQIDNVTKRRFYEKLAQADKAFSILLEQTDHSAPEFREACVSAVNWLKEHSRDSDLVRKESILYGFCRNMLGIRTFGLISSILLLLFQIIQIVLSYPQVSLELLISAIVTLAYFALWFWGITKSLVDFSAKNYAEALIFSLDRIEISKSANDN